MKVLLDTRWLGQKPTGIGWYIYELIQQFAEKNNDLELTLLGGNIQQINENWKKIPLPTLKKKLYQGFWKTVKWPRLNGMGGNQDLVHFTNGTAIPHSYKKNIITVHDLTYMEFPEMVEAKNLPFLQKTMPWSIKQASHLIAVSQDTKKDLMKYFQVPESKISVIYNGVDPIFLQTPTQEETEEVKKKYKLPGQYFLSVSTIEPRKDFGTMIEAYSLLPDSIKADHHLVIVGSKGWQNEYKKITDLIERLELKDKVHLLGYVEYKNLPAIYRLAKVYLHTSIKEGFGIGLIQAMASHLPIVASNTSCHPEIVKSAGLYFEMRNPNDLANKIIQMLNSKATRQYHIAVGSKLADNYSWKKSAQETLGIYKKIINTH